MANPSRRGKSARSGRSSTLSRRTRKPRAPINQPKPQHNTNTKEPLSLEGDQLAPEIGEHLEFMEHIKDPVETRRRIREGLEEPDPDLARIIEREEKKNSGAIEAVKAPAERVEEEVEEAPEDDNNTDDLEETIDLKKDEDALEGTSKVRMRQSRIIRKPTRTKPIEEPEQANADEIEEDDEGLLNEASLDAPEPEEQEEERKKQLSETLIKSLAGVEDEEEEEETGRRSRRGRRGGRSARAGRSARGGSVRTSRRSRRTDDAEATIDLSNRSGRAGQRMSARMSGRQEEKAPVITKGRIILASVIILLVFGAYLGYQIGMPKYYESQLVNAETYDAKQSAAQNLYNWKKSGAVGTFQTAITENEDPEVIKAAAFGLNLILSNSKGKTHTTAITASEKALDKGQETWEAMIPMLAEHAGDLYRKLDESQDLRAVEEKMNALSPLLQKVAKTTEADEARRLEAISGLSKLPVGTNCATLIEFAKTEQAPFRQASLEGIVSSAALGSMDKLTEEMSKTEDQPLHKAASNGFEKVKAQASTARLSSMLDHQDANVRKIVVSALAEKKNDSTAETGILKALNDASPLVRQYALKGVGNMKIKDASVSKLKNMANDSNQNVRAQLAITCGALNGANSYETLLKIFAQKDNEPQVIQQAIKSLGVRGMARNKKTNEKDLRAIKAVYAHLGSNAGIASKALAQLTTLRGKGFDNRHVTRADWSASRWTSWYASYKEREQLRLQAKDKLKSCDMSNLEQYATYAQYAEEAETLLNKAKALCAQDKEDLRLIDEMIQKASQAKYQFKKNQTLNYGNR